ncbi:MAG: hypothetical protein IJX88_04895 [Clostridia bacterium]|nr:hypothetical protein [Clostridia bacterium]
MNEKERVKDTWKTRKKALMETGLCFCVFLLTLLLFVFVKPWIAPENIRTGVVAQTAMTIVVGACVGVGAYFALTKTLSVKRLVILLLVVGYALRVGYMLYSAASARQQDTYTANFDGHEAYAWTLFSTGKLPTTNDYQFYHPPLNALVQAGFMRFFQAISGRLSAESFGYARPDYIEARRYMLYSSCQILSVVWSFIACVFSLKILNLFDFSGRVKGIVCAFVILYPRNIQFSGMLNNDGLSFMLAVLALYFALKWWKCGKNFVDILLCALAVGLGMMTKLSCATVCIPIAGIFIYEFVATLSKEENALTLPKMILQYGLFLFVCAPIGLWFQVYAGIRFSQPFGYVFSNLNQKLYTGNHSFFSRFILCLDVNEYFGSLWCRPFEGNYYLFNYALRSSVFGEFAYWQGEGFAVLAVVLAYLAATLLFISLFYCAIWRFRSRKNRLFGTLNADTVGVKDGIFAFLLMQSQVLSEIYFYIKMPYGCTMDFRYIMPMILAMALCLGFTQKTLAEAGGKTAQTLDTLLTVSVVGFLTVSALFYCVCI